MSCCVVQPSPPTCSLLQAQRVIAASGAGATNAEHAIGIVVTHAKDSKRAAEVTDAIRAGEVMTPPLRPLLLLSLLQLAVFSHRLVRRIGEAIIPEIYAEKKMTPAGPL